MSDHEFEKQVRQKLNDLKITPTAAAWGNIEEKMRQGRRRRIPLIWLPLLLAGMMAGIYFLTNMPQDTPKASAAISQTTVQDNDGHAVPQSSNTPAYPEASPEKQLKRSTDIQPLAAKGNNNSTTIKHAHGKTLLSIKEHTAERYTAARLRSDQKDHAALETPDTSVAILAVPATSPETKDVGSDPQQMEQQPGNKNAATAQLPAEGPIAAIKAKAAPLKQTNSKWSFAVDAYSGVVAVNNGSLLGTGQPKVEDVAYTPNFAGTVNTSFAPQYKPSTISPGFTFSAGAEVKRELSQRFSISAGLHYTQMNTRTKVGERVNGSQIVNNGTRGYLFVQSYYLLDRNEKKEYKNRYHFIEVPITLHTRINDNEKLPVYWNAGIVVSRLLSSTSLHFDGTTGVYYKNDRLLNQTQAGIATGFSFALFNKTAHPLWIGPSARSNISTILKKDISSSKHFVTLGLDVKLFLKK